MTPGSSTFNTCINQPVNFGDPGNITPQPPACPVGTQNCPCDESNNNACDTGLTCSSSSGPGTCVNNGPSTYVPPPRGGLGNACYIDGTCNTGLACVAGVCINPGCPLGVEWTRTYRSPEGPAYGYSTASDSSGNIYIAGEALNASSSNSGLDVFVAKYHSSGNMIWTRIYDNGGNESGYGVAVDSSGNVYVVGRQDTNGGDLLLLKYDPSGKLQRSLPYNFAGGTDVGRGVAVDGANIYIAGHQQNGNGSIDAALWRVDANSGNISAPIATYDSGGRNESANAVAVNSGSVYITGYHQPISSANTDMFLRAYNAAGVLQWMSPSYDSGNNQTDVGKGVAVNSASRNISVAGYQTSGKGQMFAAEYGWLNGAMLWAKTYPDAGATGGASGRAIASYADRIVIVGSQSQNNEDMLLREYESLNNTLYLLGSYISNTLFQEIGYGVNVPPPVNMGAYLKGDGIYVAGYQSLNGGEAFLSKYSCRAPEGSGTANAYFTVSPDIIFTSTTVRVDAARSGTGIKLYEWDWNYSVAAGFIPTNTGVTSSNIYGVSMAGPRVIALRITDFAGKDKIITQAITVNTNNPPTASFTATPGSGPVPLVTMPDASASSDPDASLGDRIQSFVWQWGDGTANGYGERTTHTYTRPGVYPITLVVTDSNGATASATQTITATDKYICSGGCVAPEPACWSNNSGSGNQCYQCVSGTGYQCGAGYKCLGSPCKNGNTCSDGSDCPADGICPEAVACKAGVAGACPDGSGCPANGWCDGSYKNSCVLSADTQNARCYTEGMAASTVSGSCATDLDCTASLQGGVCDTATGQCRYARCLNETDFTCASDKDCNNADGVCYNGRCDYVYDCAYGPGMGGTAGTYTAIAAKAIPKMPIGVQSNGEACTKPTPDAPNNCEGLNGCLYYNYNGNGTALAGDVQNPIGSSVANCLNKFEGGTGCVYYGDYGNTGVSSAVNCLPGTDFKKLKPKTAPDSIPLGCVVVDKGNSKKEYDCTGVNGCYYYINGIVDCDYMGGAGCIYEPNPAGAISCPRAFKAPTGGENFVQCLLNPDAVLPSFLLGSNTGGLSACRTGADCPAGAPVCISGTCYPACQGDVDCVTGGQCIDTCNPITDPCTGGLSCINGVCVNPPPINPNSFSCSDATIVHKLDYGTPLADIAVRSSQNASCRWSLFDVSFSQMVAPIGFSLNTTDLINHAAVAVGFPSAGTSTIFVSCDNGAGANVSCNVPLTLSDPCGTNADCRGNLVCIDGWCQAPECANAQPRGSLPYGTLATGTTTSMTTNANSNCVYSNSYDNADQCVAPILSCSTATPFATTGGTTHSSFLGTPPLVVGNNTQFAKCQETATPQSLSRTCSIPFSIGTCSTNYDCANGWQCVGVGSGPGVCEPPICAGATPTATTTLPYADIATGTDIGMTTDVSATCAYSENYTDPYSSMTGFAITGGQAHSTNIPILAGWNKKYVKCLETASGEETGVCTIRFNVEGAQCGSGAVCPSGLECRSGRCAFPICSGAYPRGRQEVGAMVPIGMTSGASSECRFADTLIPYIDMTNVFLTLDRLVHGKDGVTQNTVQVVEGNNTQYVACRADAAPNNIKTCTIPFTGGSCRTSFDCTLGMVCNGRDCIDDPCNDSDPSNDPPGGCIIDPVDGKPCPPFCGDPWVFRPPPKSCSIFGYEFFNHAVRPTGNCSLVAIILALLSWLAWIIALLAVLSGLRAAYLYITSAGDEKKLRLAYQYLIYTTIGVGVAILSFSAVAITRAIFNI